MQSSEFNNALQQFNSWLKNNNLSFKDIISTRDNSNLQSNTNNRSVSALPSYEYKQAIDVAKRLETGTTTAKDFADLIQNNKVSRDVAPEELLDLNRSFKDIVEEGPKSAVEQKLINAVDTFLSPQEKKQAVDQNLNVGDVVKQVNQSIQKSQELAMQVLDRNKEHEKDNKKHEKDNKKEAEKKMTSLGDEFGVLDAIVKSMRQALETGQEKALEKENSQKKFKVESVPFGNIGDTLKTMGKNPNHEQNKEQNKGWVLSK